jgi:hypothetical protein
MFGKNWQLCTLLANAKFACNWQPVTYNLYLSDCQSHANCTRMAASLMHHE